MLAFTFPGQGSQRPGMGRPWADHPSWEVVAEASEALGRDLGALLLDAPMEELTATAHAQLTTLVLSLVVLDAVERLGLAPSACAGHSLGEYSALVATGALSMEDALAVVAARGEAMQRAGEDAPGTMAALLGLSDDDAEAACQRAEGDVWVANYNAPGQVVIAGEAEALGRASKLAKQLGARRVLSIPVSGAFHTPLMAAARPPLRKALADACFAAPEVPLVANVDARVHDDPEEWPQLLSAQLCSPVRWRQSLSALVGLGTTMVVELGPGGVLTGLARRAEPEVRALSVSEPAHLDGLMDALASGEPHLADPTGGRPGEHLYVTERVVVSPGPGIFRPEASVAAGGHGLFPGTPGSTEPGASPDLLAVGDLVARVGVTEVRTPFAGRAVRWLATSGERVHTGQPLLWLSSTDALER